MLKHDAAVAVVAAAAAAVAAAAAAATVTSCKTISPALLRSKAWDNKGSYLKAQSITPFKFRCKITGPNTSTI